jgi:PAS domain S-box-containing protein
MDKRLRVLIVEDSESDAALDIRVLEQAGYRTSHERVEDPKEMEAALSRQAWDVIIADHCLPKMDAFRALELARESGQDIPVIVVSGAIGEETAVMIMKAGAQDYVMKDKLMRLAPAVERELQDFKIRCERTQAEKALRQSEEKYRTVLEEMREGYYETDLAGNLTRVNAAMRALLGYSRKELMGTKYIEYAPEEYTKTISEATSRLYRTGEPVRDLHHEVIRKDGSRAFVETSILVMRDEKGEKIGFRGISRDITTRKKVEEDKRIFEIQAQVASRLASIGEMAAGVAHEINNPLTGIIGYSQLLIDREWGVPEDIRSDLVTINEGSRRVAGIVQGLLTFSRQTKPERRCVDINQIVESTLALRAYNLRVNNIEVVTQLAPDLLETFVDPGQIQQVLLNLIVNAETEMKLAHSRGKLTITTEKSDNTIKIRLTDDGPGIEPEIMARIFEPFFTTREVGKGTGLGLSLCYGIVSEHNGKIYAESEPGKGATFIVELPVISEAKQPESKSAEPLEPFVKRPKKLATARVMVVDDEIMIRDLVKRVLSSEGHEVDALDNSADALKKIEGQPYDVILLDIKMPGMDGMELYRLIKEKAKSLVPRVVFITGDMLSKDTQEFLFETELTYIAKPFDAEQLRRKVSVILNR